MSWRLAEQFFLTDVADPAFAAVPLDALTDPERNAALAAQVPDDALLPIADGEPYGGLDPPDTTHISVVDADGTVVSMTNTLSNFWGSGQYVLGFFANDQLRYFRPPESSGHEPEPGKRPRAYSTPTIVFDADERPVLTVGLPGGRRIPHILGQVLLRWALHGEPLEEAVAAPRFHITGDVLEFEELPPPDAADALRARGYAALEQPPSLYHFGAVHALEIDHDAGELRGVADARREGDWRVEALSGSPE
jgi:gamma-glutamyltranspeptidase / glutathione hydrolase